MADQENKDQKTTTSTGAAGKLEQAVDAIVSRLERAENFAIEQAPDVCKEIIAEKKGLAIYDMVVSTGFMAGLAKLSFFLASFVDAEGYRSVIWPVLTAIIAGSFATVSLICALGEVKTFISLRTAPKLTILRELRDLLKKEDKSE